MLSLVLVTPPAETPVSLVEAKAHLRVDNEDEDTLIGVLVAAATSYLDGWSGILGRALVTQSWRFDLCRFSDRIALPLAPVQSVAITYYDASNLQQTASANIYSLFSDGAGPYIRRLRGQSWPGIYSRDDAVRVTMVAGYGAAAAVPTAIKQAMLLLIGHWYASREAVNIGNITTSLPFAADALLAPFRRVGL